MRMVGLRIIPMTAADEISETPATVVDILWSGVLPADRVEHIYLDSSNGHVNLVLFQLVDSFEEARASVYKLWQRVSRRSQLLRGKYDVEIYPLEWY